MVRHSHCLKVLLLLGTATGAQAATLSVGPSGTYPAPCAAFAAASDGDVIEIDSAGIYDGDVCAVSKNSLIVRGTGSARARIDASGKSSQGKAIWVVQGRDTTIENIEFSGAKVPDQNGAGIRQEGMNLVVRNCVFRDNQEGILAGDASGSEILIEYSEFDHNGAGDGYSHNLYINHVAKLTFRFNYSHRAVIGHLLKSRAAENYILYNRLSGEADGSPSYEIDLPNGGKSYVVGNVVEQGKLTDNPNMLAYLEEGTHPSNPSDELFVINNTWVNHLGRGTFLFLGTAVTTPSVIQNNIFFGGGTLSSQADARRVTNLEGGDSCFVSDESFDYRLRSSSPCKDAGSNAEPAGDFPSLPTSMYRHPAQGETRPNDGNMDVGAFEEGASPSGGSSGIATGTPGGGSGASSTAQAGSGTASGGSVDAGSSSVDGGSPGESDEGCGCSLFTRGARGTRWGAWLVLAAAAIAGRAPKRSR